MGINRNTADITRNAVAKSGDTMTGTLVFTAGTAAAPSISFSGDTDTGIYSAGAGDIGFSIDGTAMGSLNNARLALTRAGGNVGIYLNSTGGSGRNWGWISTTTGGCHLYDATGGANRLLVTPTGLGINISPSYKLDVSNGDADGIIARFTRGFGATNNPRFELSTNEASQQAVFDATGSATPNFFLRTGGTNRLTITNDGRVAINSIANTNYTMSVVSHSNSSSHYAFNVASATWATNMFYVMGDGQVVSPPTYNTFTTTNAANVYVNSGGGFFRSTSSIKYKTQVEDLDPTYADKLLDFRPVWYRSTCEAERKDWSWYGFIAEELAAIEPRFVDYKQNEDGTLEPEGVQYSRIVVPLVALVQKQQQQINTQQQQINDLMARVAALEGQMS